MMKSGFLQDLKKMKMRIQRIQTPTSSDTKDSSSCICVKQTCSSSWLSILSENHSHAGKTMGHSRLTFHMSSAWLQTQTAVSTTKGLRIVVLVLSSSSHSLQGSSYSSNNISLFITTLLRCLYCCECMLSSIRRDVWHHTFVFEIKGTVGRESITSFHLGSYNH